MRAGSVMKTAMEYYSEPGAVLGDVEVAVSSCWADPEQAARIVISDRPYQVASFLQFKETSPKGTWRSSCSGRR